MSRLLALAGFACLASGCAHTIEVPTAPPPPPPPVTRAGPPASFEYVGVTFDGAPSNVSDELLLGIATRLRKSGLFAAVFEPAVSHEAPPGALRLSLQVDQREELEGTASGMLKAIFVIYSIGLLSPLLPYHYAYEVRVGARLEGAGGWGRSYEGRASGVASYDSLFSDAQRVGVETRSRVLARALEWLVWEMARDEELTRSSAFAR
jgi:hypothetical protein